MVNVPAHDLSDRPPDGVDAPRAAVRSAVADGESLLSYSAAAERLGIKEDHLRKLTYRRQIPFIKLPPGGRTAKVRFDPYDLAAWVDAHKVPTGADINGQGDELEGLDP